MKGSIKTKLDMEAYERDNNRCVKCANNKGIEAHHIVPGFESIDNLITLCHSCHKKEHNMAGCFKRGHDSRRNNDWEGNLKSFKAGHIPWNKGLKFT